MLTFGTNYNPAGPYVPGASFGFANVAPIQTGGVIDPFDTMPGDFAVGVPVPMSGAPVAAQGQSNTVNVDGSSRVVSGLSNLMGSLLNGMGARSDAPPNAVPAVWGGQQQPTGLQPMTLAMLGVAGLGVYLVATA